jgi:hypothetical protein
MHSIVVACLQCKVYLNVGQSCSEYDEDMNHRWESFICTGERKTMKAFNSFLNDHVMRCHKVALCSDGDGDPHIEKLCRMDEYKPAPKKKVK